MKKLFITLTMALMLFVGTTSSASAVSLADLQQQIKDLTEQVAALSQALGAQSFSIPLTGALQTTSATITPIVNTSLLQSATTTTATPTAVKTIVPTTIAPTTVTCPDPNYTFDPSWGCIPTSIYDKNKKSGQVTQNDNTASPFATGTVLRPGTKGSADVMKMQQLLKDKGFYSSTIDGSYGPGTIAAVRAFQAAQGYKADGIAGPMTLGSLVGGSWTPASGGVLPGSTNPVGTTTLTARRCTATSTPWIQTLSPNGGEVYQEGQQITVKWKSCNISPSTNLDIVLIPHNTLGQPLWTFGFDGNSASLNDGQETLTIPTISSMQSQTSGVMPGLYYKVIVQQSGGTNPYDYSDNLFTINESGLSVEIISSSNNSTSQLGINNDLGIFSIKFKITSDEDVYIPRSVARGISYQIQKAGVAISQGVGITETITSIGNVPTTTNGNWRIDGGDSETFEASFAVQLPSAGTAGLYRAVMNAIKWSATDSFIPASTVQLNPPYQTAYLYLN